MSTTDSNASGRHPLIIGAESGIGRALVARYAALGVTVSGTGRRGDGRWLFLDLAAVPATWKPPVQADTAVLCAAVTGEASCRSHPGAARRINVEATVQVARILVDHGCFVQFLSSNLVFDGRQPMRPIEEPVAPASLYGRLKAEAEAGIQALGDRAAVIRLTKVIDRDTPLFRGWLAALARGETVRPFHDMVFAPLSVAFVVDALVRLAQRRTSGILHLSAAADISYADAAHHFARRLGVPAAHVQAIGRTGAGIPDAVAPRHTSLAMGQVEREAGLVAPDPFDTLDAVFALKEHGGV